MVHLHIKINTKCRIETTINRQKLFINSYELLCCCWLSFIISINELFFCPEWIIQWFVRKAYSLSLFLPQTLQKYGLRWSHVLIYCIVLLIALFTWIFLCFFFCIIRTKELKPFVADYEGINNVFQW